MKKYFIFLILVLTLFCFNICYAANYEVEKLNSDTVIEAYEAHISDYFPECEALFRIGKMRIYSTDFPYYCYRFIIGQSSPPTLNVKEIVLMSEVDNVRIPLSPENYITRKKGIDFTQDIILYASDPGNINRLIDSTNKKMLIILKTQDGKEYQLWPTSAFIDGARKVAQWS